MPTPLSQCCKAPLTVAYGDEGTSYYVCMKCSKPDDPIFTENGVIQNLNPSPSTPQDWREEFDEKFGKFPNKNAHLLHRGSKICLTCGHPANPSEVLNDVKSFIEKVLAEALSSKAKELVSEVGKLNEKVPCDDCPKGGLVGENEIPCDTCGGSEWYRKHACAFNDGENKCECFELALSAVQEKIKEIMEK